MKLKDLTDLLRISGVKGTWTLASHSNRLRRITRQALIVMGLTALEKCGLNDELLSAEGLDLSRHDELDTHTLRALCEYLYEIGVLEETAPGVYCARSRRRFQNLLKVMYGYYAYHEPLQMMDRLIRKEAVYGPDVARDDRYDAMASADLTQHFSFPFSASMLENRRFDTFADLGSGTGEYCAFLAGRFPEARFYAVDLAESAVLEGRERGLESARVKLVAGDMRDLKSIDLGADAVDIFSIMFVLHEFHDDAVLAILHGIRDSHPGSAVLLTELIGKPSREVRRERRRVFPELKIVHELSHQVLRPPERWKELFARAGFELLAERSHRLTNHVAMLFVSS